MGKSPQLRLIDLTGWGATVLWVGREPTRERQDDLEAEGDLVR